MTQLSQRWSSRHASLHRCASTAANDLYTSPSYLRKQQETKHPSRALFLAIGEPEARHHRGDSNAPGCTVACGSVACYYCTVASAAGRGCEACVLGHYSGTPLLAPPGTQICPHLRRHCLPHSRWLVRTEGLDCLAALPLSPEALKRRHVLSGGEYSQVHRARGITRRRPQRTTSPCPAPSAR